MTTDREMVAQHFREAATELRTAADHLDIAAGHFIDAEVPRGCAHAYAAEGHILNASELIDANAKFHAIKAHT